MLLLYDEANQSDFVAAFDERYALEDHGFKAEVTWVGFLYGICKTDET
jgi:hypothetical protein